MWIITEIGFFSVVQKRGDEPLSVRARVKDDIEALAARIKKLTEYDAKIIFTPANDYHWRIKVPHKIFASVLAQLIVNDLTYPNFKGRIDQVQPERHTIYAEVWAALSGLNYVDLRRKLRGDQ